VGDEGLVVVLGHGRQAEALHVVGSSLVGSKDPAIGAGEACNKYEND